MTKRGFFIEVLKLVRDQRIYCYEDDNISSVGRCVLYWLVVLFTKECVRHWYSIQVGVGYIVLNSDY